MNQVLEFHRSTVGKKVLMAVTGIILVGFLVGHMLGNLKIFYGAEKFDAYAEFLRAAGSPLLGHGQALWIFRLVLLASVAVHMWAAITLAVRNRAARGPQGYRKQAPDASSYASRTMLWGGVIIALYVVYHILHFTTGQAHTSFQPGAVYANVVSAFKLWPVAGVYILAQLVLGFHLYHGIWSGLRTLGASNPRFESFRRGLSAVLALAVTAGFVAVPVAVLAGLVK